MRNFKSISDDSSTTPILLIGATGNLGHLVARWLNDMEITMLGTHCSHPSPRTHYLDLTAEVRLLPKQCRPELCLITASVAKKSQRLPVKQITKNLKALSPKHIVFVSSDAVFSGEAGLYSASDEPNPRTSYGKNTLLLERIVADLAEATIVRTGHLFGLIRTGLDARTHAIFAGLLRGEAIERFGDMYRSVCSYNDLARALVSIVALWNARALKGSRITHLSGHRVSMYEHARAISQAVGFDVSLLHRSRMPIKTSIPRDTSLSSGPCPKGLEWCPETAEDYFRRHRLEILKTQEPE